MNATLVRLVLLLASAAALSVAVISLPAPRTAAGQEDAPTAAAADTTGATADEAPLDEQKAINVFELALAGGIFMIPIALLSLIGASIAIERSLALRRSRVVPRGLVSGLGEMSSWAGGADTQRAWRLCQQFPSAAANVMRALLARVGRPLPEIEAAAAVASQREADKLYANVRWLNLAATISTMLGLIGTIQGMILAFHRLTTLDAAADRTTLLATGIYTALVTTFAGLSVAIPALFLAHYFEGRILRLFHEIDELTQLILPQLARSESRTSALEAGPNGDNRKLPSTAPQHAS